jgi:hypothetical protein
VAKHLQGRLVLGLVPRQELKFHQHMGRKPGKISFFLAGTSKSSGHGDFKSNEWVYNAKMMVQLG